MTDWTMWATFLAVGTGIAVLATYFICESRIERTQSRIVALEREMALARTREEANEKRLAKILEAVDALRETTEDRLGNLRDKLNELLAKGSRIESQ
jgi:HAMP domain-containing protein